MGLHLLVSQQHITGEVWPFLQQIVYLCLSPSYMFSPFLPLSRQPRRGNLIAMSEKRKPKVTYLWSVAPCFVSFFLLLLLPSLFLVMSLLDQYSPKTRVLSSLTWSRLDKTNLLSSFRRPWANFRKSFDHHSSRLLLHSSLLPSSSVTPAHSCSLQHSCSFQLSPAASSSAPAASSTPAASSSPQQLPAASSSPLRRSTDVPLPIPAPADDLIQRPLTSSARYRPDTVPEQTTSVVLPSTVRK
ncbi:unnamed protein product [Acanthosepion pharaonis]|uniref:Uncharacterized protein n=1 Tax=Acanthosepion pharaonis TaxID=158019 RepID=A0A812CRA7_ACAPH|nr:unnamed protein product [Sepia pharaonis]